MVLVGLGRGKMGQEAGAVGIFVVTGDCSQFYYSFMLLSKQWNLQRFLWRENLDPNNPVMEGIIGSLIYGIKCVSCQTETAMEDIADKIEAVFPVLANFIRKYNAMFLEELKRLTVESDMVFASIG
jgi:hypothetical protein